MDNLNYWNAMRSVPAEALKTIEAGNLKGKSDINPVWRLKTLTEQFGMCGIGWKIANCKYWLETADVVDNGVVKREVCAFCSLDLHIKVDGQWSDAIPGIGGSKLAGTGYGKQANDECYKMAQTDAISVAAKMLGVAADVYFEKDKSKYKTQAQVATQPAQPTLRQELNVEVIEKINKCNTRDELRMLMEIEPIISQNETLRQMVNNRWKQVA